MNNTVKGIITGSVCLVVLVGGFVALKLTDKTDDDTTDDDSLIATANHVFYEYDKNEITKVEVSNSEGGYTLYRTAEATDDTDATYTIEGIEDYNTNDTIISTIANNCSSMDALELIDENPDDLSLYGLDDPIAEVTLYLDDGTSETFLVGDDSPVEGVYFKLADDTAVYTVDETPLYVFTKNKIYFVSRILLETPSDDDYPIVEKVTVERSDLDYDIVLEYDHRSDDENYIGGTSATHIMTSPVYAYLNVDNSESITNGMFGLSGDSVISLSPTQEELEVAGITNPTCVVTMECDDGNTYTLTIGESYTSSSYGEDSTYTAYFGYFDGIDILFAFSESSIPWISLEPTDITSQLVFGTYIYDVAELSIITDDTTLEFEGSGTSDDFSVTLNGEEFDLNRYKSFYQALIKAPAEELYLDEVSGNPVATVTMTLTSGDTDTVEFYRIDDRKTVIVHNGISSFACRTSFVEKSLLPNISNINGDDDFVTNW